ncbi:hypothetical protein P885DRAFT_36938 [Corynascus similis CBS 632.67]
MLLLAQTTTSSLSSLSSSSSLRRTQVQIQTKLLARQWLVLYQQGPLWVPPLVHTGVLSNLYLAFSSSSSSGSGSGSSSSPFLYLAAALVILSVLPLTFLVMEPGINGACKWKVAEVLKGDKGDDGESGNLPVARRVGERSIGIPSVTRHSASEGSKRWAEEVGIGELVVAWAQMNHVRWVMGIVAGGLSFGALCSKSS